MPLDLSKDFLKNVFWKAWVLDMFCDEKGFMMIQAGKHSFCRPLLKTNYTHVC